MTIPKKYEDLTVEQFQQLEALKTNIHLEQIDVACRRLSILSGKDIDYIESLSPTVVYNHLLDALYLNQPLLTMDCPESFTLGFKKFKYVSEISQYTVAQQKDFTEFLKQNDNDYIKCLPQLMAICHLELSLKGWVYDSSTHKKNVELFKKSKLKDSLGGVFFYSKFLINYSTILKDFLEESMIAIASLTNDEEFQDFLNNGDGSTQ